MKPRWISLSSPSAPDRSRLPLSLPLPPFPHAPQSFIQQLEQFVVRNCPTGLRFNPAGQPLAAAMAAAPGASKPAAPAPPPVRKPGKNLAAMCPLYLCEKRRDTLRSKAVSPPPAQPVPASQPTVCCRRAASAASPAAGPAAQAAVAGGAGGVLLRAGRCRWRWRWRWRGCEQALRRAVQGALCTCVCTCVCTLTLQLMYADVCMCAEPGCRARPIGTGTLFGSATPVHAALGCRTPHSKQHNPLHNHTPCTRPSTHPVTQPHPLTHSGRGDHLGSAQGDG